MNKLSVTIGIPALNEEMNIHSLISDILSQNETNFKIVKIIVSSDGSKDKTVQTVRGIKDKRIDVIDNKITKGQGERQNQIIKLANTEILVLLNADIRITDKNFVRKLIKPILNGKCDLTSSKLSPTTPRNFFEKVLCKAEDYKESIFIRLNSGNNLYTCHGGARAFTKIFYKQLYFKTSVAEDAFTYFYCVTNGYGYKYASSAVAYYTLPDNINDHVKRSIRYFNSPSLLVNEFGLNIVKNSYNLPFVLCTVFGLVAFIKDPLYISAYLFVIIYTKYRNMIKDGNSKFSNTWEVSKSTKGVIV